MDVTISIGRAAALDLPAWLQAVAAFVALAVTVFQWWSVRRDAKRERLARQLSGHAVLRNAHRSLALQSERLAQVRINAGEPAMFGYAKAILEAGFDLTEQMVLGIDISGLPEAGVEALMSGKSAVQGVRLALQDMASLLGQTNPDPQLVSIRDSMAKETVEQLVRSLAQLDRSATALRAAILGK